MPHPCPHHCPPERGGRGLALLAVATVIIVVSAARPVAHAVEAVLQIAAITVGAIVGLAAIGAVTWAVVAVRRRQADRRPLTARAVRQLPANRPRAIEPPRRVYGTTSVHPESAQASEHQDDSAKHGKLY